MCHSTSICHFWDPIFTFEPLSSIIFMKIAPKVTPRWPRSYIKSLKSIWENECFLRMDQSDFKVNLIYPKWPQSGPWVRKMIPKRPQSHPKMTRAAPLQTFFRILVASVTSKILRKNEYNLFMDPFGPDTKRHDMHYMCHSTSICHFWHPFLHFPPIFFHYFDKNCCQRTSN